MSRDLRPPEELGAEGCFSPRKADDPFFLSFPFLPKASRRPYASSGNVGASSLALPSFFSPFSSFFVN